MKTVVIATCAGKQATLEYECAVALPLAWGSSVTLGDLTGELSDCKVHLYPDYIKYTLQLVPPIKFKTVKEITRPAKKTEEK
jgi:hypothetical protein